MAAKGSEGGVGTLKSTSINRVKLFSVTGKNYVAPWVLTKKKCSLRKDAGKPPPRLREFPRSLACLLFIDSLMAPLLFACLVPEYQQRLELIHDLRFETATTRIKVTPDGQYVIASGTQAKHSLFSVCVSGAVI